VLVEEPDGHFMRRDYSLAAWRVVFEGVPRETLMDGEVDRDFSADGNTTSDSINKNDDDDKRWLKPDGVIGFWKSRVPDAVGKRLKWAPGEVMLQFFEELEGRPDQEDMRYILSLLLVRRRILVVEEELSNTPPGVDERGRPVMTLRDVKQDRTYLVSVETPTADRHATIQAQLAELRS
jgi:hypothetical protein